MELGESDASGRRRPVPVKGSEFVAEYNTVIAAIGQSTEIPGGFKVAAERGNAIKTSAGSVTSREGVFAGGDAASGPGLVIEAIAAGRNGAIAIDKYFGGKGIISEDLAPAEEIKPCLGRGDGFARLEREKMPCLETEKRLGNFSEIELGYQEDAAIKEATRCLQCDLRLRITPVKFPPKRVTTKGSH
jgi:NADH-quinone oxidoreductase subunit F